MNKDYLPPHAPHPPKNFTYLGVSRRDMQRVARLQASRNLKRTADQGILQGHFFMLPGDVTV